MTEDQSPEPDVPEIADVVDDLATYEQGPCNPLRIPDEQALEDLLRHFATQDAPRVFALCEVAPGWRKAGITAWGMSFPDRAVLFMPGDRSIGFFSSAECAASMFGRGRDMRLIWPDFVPLREMVEQ